MKFNFQQEAATARAIIQQAHSIVAFSGAGLSAESKVPTFRDAQTDGMWTNYDPEQLASPEGFARDPELVIEWYRARRRDIANAAPNPAHYSLAKRLNLTNITQNVDNLLERAGAQNVIHLHGDLTQDRCHSQCGYKDKVDLTDPPGPKSCPQCGSRVRPNVVWFGEMLPKGTFELAQQKCSQCDVLLVIGTSAVVYPAASLIGVARKASAKIFVVNTERSGANNLGNIEFLGKAGEIVPKLLL